SLSAKPRWLAQLSSSSRTESTPCANCSRSLVSTVVPGGPRLRSPDIAAHTPHSPGRAHHRLLERYQRRVDTLTQQAEFTIERGSRHPLPRPGRGLTRQQRRDGAHALRLLTQKQQLPVERARERSEPGTAHRALLSASRVAPILTAPKPPLCRRSVPWGGNPHARDGGGLA